MQVRTIALWLALASLLNVTADANDSLRCDKRIISVGDSLRQVSQACQEQIAGLKSHQENRRIRNANGVMMNHRVTITRMLVDVSRNSRRQLVFVNGVLDEVQELGF